MFLCVFACFVETEPQPDVLHQKGPPDGVKFTASIFLMGSGDPRSHVVVFLLLSSALIADIEKAQ
jgi:hypothetical protein